MGSCLFVAYQNFESLSEEDLRTLEIMKQMTELEKTSVSSKVAIPRKGRDLASVRDDWVEQQGSLLLDGADQRLLDTLNHKIQSLFKSDETSSAKAEISEGESASAEASVMDNFRFATLNRMEYRWSESSQLSCILETQGASLDYSQRLSHNTSWGVVHQGSENQTQLVLKHQW